jgi:phosphoribosylformimino-5-aminoimidazole carboxamide ribotide isomerase
LVQKAVQEPQFARNMARTFPGHVLVGLDAKDGKVATDGWAIVSEHDASDLALQFQEDGVVAITYTDIARDGMMQGVNVEATVKLARTIKYSRDRIRWHYPFR